MMDPIIIRSLKRSNISVDSDKTRVRTEEIWKSASRQEKRQIIEQADVKLQTIYRIYNTGAISAKLAVAIAQVMNADPNYLTGATDENQECSALLLEKFLRDQGYSKLLDTHLPRPKRKYERRAKPEEEIVSAQNTVTGFEALLANAAAESEEPLTQLSEDELILLLRALLIRAQSNENAAMRLAMIKRALL